MCYLLSCDSRTKILHAICFLVLLCAKIELTVRFLSVVRGCEGIATPYTHPFTDEFVGYSFLHQLK